MGLATWRLLIAGAGLGHLLIVVAGLMAPRVLGYAEKMRGVEPLVREVFQIHNWYMTSVAALMAALCFAFPDDLAGRSALGRLLSGYLAAFWLARLGLQVFYHNAEVKRARPVMNALFTATFLYLGGVFAALALLAPAAPR